MKDIIHFSGMHKEQCSAEVWILIGIFEFHDYQRFQSNLERTLVLPSYYHSFTYDILTYIPLYHVSHHQ